MLEGGKGEPQALEGGGGLHPGESSQVLIKSLLMFLNYPSPLPLPQL